MCGANKAAWLVAVIVVSASLATACNVDVMAQLQCEAAGGEWARWSIFSPDPFCNLRTSDGGTPCTDSSQCEGDCISSESDCAEGITGECSEFQGTGGCHCYLSETGGNSVICVD